MTTHGWTSRRSGVHGPWDNRTHATPFHYLTFNPRSPLRRGREVRVTGVGISLPQSQVEVRDFSPVSPCLTLRHPRLGPWEPVPVEGPAYRRPSGG